MGKNKLSWYRFLLDKGAKRVGFRHYVLDNGLNLYIQPTTKFKTVMVKGFWHQNLDADATKNSLLALVLKRGTRQNPTSQGINRLLEELYGAEFDSRVIKKGERHILEFAIELVNDSFVPEPIFDKGLELMREVLLDPLTENNATFNQEYLRQEKEQLRQMIESIYNDKVQYAVERCLEEMGKGERFGISRYGKVEEFPSIDATNLYQHYLLHRDICPIDLFVTGDVIPDEVYRSVNRVFNFRRSGGYELLPVKVKAAVGKVKEVVERQEINQGKLCLAYRTGLNFADQDYPALAVYNGVLGGFAHSKLFQNVREKESLAYYASSRLEKSKGVLLISSGIEFENYHRARKIIEAQVAEIAEGKVSESELENTKLALQHGLLASTDNYNLTMDMALDGLINGRPRDYRELIEQIAAVNVTDLTRVAGNINLDTVYFLTNTEGAGENG